MANQTFTWDNIAIPSTMYTMDNITAGSISINTDRELHTYDGKNWVKLVHNDSSPECGCFGCENSRKEKKIRDDNPLLNELYEKYQTLLIILAGESLN